MRVAFWLLAFGVIAWAVGAGPAVAGAPQVQGARFGSKIAFHGWSTTSRFVAYTRTRFLAPERRRGPPRVETQRMHRLVRDGVFEGFGTWVGGDVEGLAREHHYVITQAPRERPSRTVSRFHVGASVFDVEWVVGDKVGWVFRHGDEVLAQGTFETLYVDGAFELYPSPDGRQAVLLGRLDAGWVVDTGIFPVPLTRAGSSTRTDPAKGAPPHARE